MGEKRQRSVTRRDPMPSYGATLDLFEALDRFDLELVTSHLDPLVTGTIRLPDEATISFSSRADYERSVGRLLAAFRSAEVQCATTVRRYDATRDPTTVVASMELHRVWLTHDTTVRHRGHATLVWSTPPGGKAHITHWRITWEIEPETGSFRVKPPA